MSLQARQLYYKVESARRKFCLSRSGGTPKFSVMISLNDGKKAVTYVAVAT